MPAVDADSLLTYIVALDRMDRAGEIDFLASYFRLIYEEKGLRQGLRGPSR